MYVEACAFFDAVVLDCIFDGYCAAIGDCFPLDTSYSELRICSNPPPASFDDSCPFKFRHRLVYVRLSQMTSEVFCDGLSGGGKEYRTRGSHLRSRSISDICVILR